MTAVPNLVADFGAVGDDCTLNDTAIAGFLSAAASAHAGFIPPGVFRTASGFYLPNGVERLYGAGKKASQIRVVNTNPTCAIGAVGAAGQGNALVIEDIGILAPIGSNTVEAIAVINNSRAIIRRCMIDGWAAGIWMSNSYACIVEENYLTNMLGYVIAFNNDDSANGATVAKNSIFASGNANSQYVVNIPGTYGCVQVEGNDIEGCWGGFALTNIAGGTFAGNWCERNGNRNWSMSGCGADFVSQAVRNYNGAA